MLLSVLGSFLLVRHYLNSNFFVNLASFSRLGYSDFALVAALERVVDHLHTCGAAGLVALTGLLLGDCLLQGISLRSWQLRLVISTMLGYAVIALLFFGLAAGHLLYAIVLRIIIIGVPVLRRRRVVALARFLMTRFSLRQTPLIDLILITTICTLAGSSLLYALAPPVTYDALQYHLSTPQVYLQAHALVDIPYNLTSHYPPYLGIVYFISSIFGSECAPQLLSWYTGFLTAVLIYGFARRFGLTRRVGLLAGVVFLSVPYIFILSSQVWVDLGVSLAVCCSLVLLLEWVEQQQSRLVALAGILAGFALGAKYSAVVDLLALEVVLIVLLVSGPQRGWRNRGRILVIFNICTLSVCAPHLAWNELRTDNPVFPMLSGLFSQPPWYDNQAARSLFETNRRPEFGDPLTSYFDLFYRQHLHNSTVGPLPQIGLLVLLLMFRRRAPPACKILVIFLLADSLFYWATRGVSIRYASVIAINLILLSMWVWQELLDSRKFEGVTVFLVLSISAWLFSFQLMLGNVGPNSLRYTLGIEDRDTYLEQELMTSFSDAANFLNARPEAGRVLMVGESRAYYLRRPFLADGPYSERSIIGDQTRSASSPEALWHNLHDMGVTEIMVNVAETTRLRNVFYDWDHNTLQRFLAFLHDETEVVYRDSGVIIHRLLSEARSVNSSDLVFDEKLYYLPPAEAADVFDGLRLVQSPVMHQHPYELLSTYEKLVKTAPRSLQLRLWTIEAATALGRSDLVSMHRKIAEDLIDPEVWIDRSPE